MADQKQQVTFNVGEWLTPDNLAKAIRIVMALVLWYTGKDGGAGLMQLLNSEGGVAGAVGDGSAAPVVGNMIAAAIAAVIFLRPNKVSEWLSRTLGLDGASTATKFYHLVTLHKQYLATSSEDVRTGYRIAAQGIINDLFEAQVVTPAQPAITTTTTQGG